jgi:hypothetical protein
MPQGRRPSAVEQYAARVAEWLRENPTLRAIEILRRARSIGYLGGKSALYELVRRVRTRPVGGQRARPQQLVIIARDLKHLGNFFKLAFEGNPTIQVTTDRRIGERRMRSEPHAHERRQHNRRSPQMSDRQLRAVGWTIVRLRTGKP